MVLTRLLRGQLRLPLPRGVIVVHSAGQKGFHVRQNPDHEGTGRLRKDVAEFPGVLYRLYFEYIKHRHSPCHLPGAA